MENFKSLFIATGIFTVGMISAAHLRHPHDSAISYLMSSAQAAPAHLADAKPVTDATASRQIGQAAPLFTTLPLSAMPAQFEAHRPQAETKQQARRSPARASSGPRVASQAPAKPVTQVVAENPIPATSSSTRLRYDPLGEFIRSLIGGRAG